MLRIDNISKRFKNGKRAAVDSVSFTVEAHELVSLVGESGSGKTTILRLIAGLEKPSSGSIHCGERCFAGENNWIPPEKRRVGLVFQGGALFPHMTATQNIGYALGRASKDVIEETAADLLERVHLPGLGDRYPHELSGGEAQRVALARALAAKPEVILLDEPYSNLDVSTTAKLREEIRSILIAEKMTGILVTHDPADARHFGQRVAILRSGKLEQIDSVQEVTSCPANDYCRLLIGER
ncbi:MAG: ABC transporter ATP-binding protein [Verrucomicrobiota bacterium]